MLLGLISCQEEPSLVIDEVLKPYVDMFLIEAENRGKQIDLETNGLSAHVMTIAEPGILGQCYTYSDDSRQIVIDTDTWVDLSELGKEYLMMHELGHCVLDLGHNDSIDQNGNCLSIMQSGTGSCQVRYNQNNREQLLDELFSY